MSKLQKWEPPRELAALRGQINKFFDEVFSLHNELMSLTDLSNWWTGTMITDDKEEIVIKINLPDLEPEDVDITIEENHLIISGKKKQETQHRAPTYYYQQQSYSAFKRIVTLAEPVKPEAATASYNGKVLEVRLPRNPSAKQKSYKVPLK